MTQKTTFWTISEAARQLGYKSRSQLYRLIEEGLLRDYVYPNKKGRTYLLAESEKKRSLWLGEKYYSMAGQWSFYRCNTCKKCKLTVPNIQS